MIIWKDDDITLFRSALYETVSSVIFTNDCVIVVDPCWLPNEVEEIKKFVASRQENRQLYLLFTHSDFDHIIGYKAFPEVSVIASYAFYTKNSKEKDSIIELIKEFDDEYYITRDYEVVYPEVDFPIQGERITIKIGETKLTFFQAPGHTDDGLFTIIEPAGILLTGDYLSDIEFPYIDFNSYEYEKTILKLDLILAEYPIKLLVTGHGNATADHFEMKKRQQESLEYIHKMREFILENNQAGIDQLISGCKFPRNMKKYHLNNQKLFQKELGV